MARATLKEITQPCFVLDFTEETGFFTHKLENGSRAETLARLLRYVFCGEDRPMPSSGKDGIEAYRAYKTLEEIQKHIPNISVYDFSGLIPSLNKVLEKIGVQKGGGMQLTPDQQDALFQNMKKFFGKITPIQEAKMQIA
jgi:hypothetical protein